jgi:dienelactone hydrolase
VHWFVRRLVRGFAIAAATLVGAVVSFLAMLALEHRGETVLPTPTGSRNVGRAIEVWTDGTHELLVWIWYPSAPAASGVNADYLPARLRAEYESARSFVINTLFTHDLSKVRTHSVENAEVSAQHPSYPVIIMRGGGSSEVVNYSALAEDLASHGYVVAGSDAPTRTNVVAFPDGRVIRRAPENNPENCIGRPDQHACASLVMDAWSADIAFVLDRLEALNQSTGSGRFAGRLDMTRVGIFGHSFGGATAAHFCGANPRCKAGIDIDGAPLGNVIQSGIDRPFMFLLSDHTGETDPGSDEIRSNIRRIYDRLPADRRQYLEIRGGNHFFFNDDLGLLKSRLVLGILRVFGVVGIDGRRQLEIAAHSVHTFFDRHLKGVTTAALATDRYPELQVVH